LHDIRESLNYHDYSKKLGYYNHIDIDNPDEISLHEIYESPEINDGISEERIRFRYLIQLLGIYIFCIRKEMNGFVPDDYRESICNIKKMCDFFDGIICGNNGFFCTIDKYRHVVAIIKMCKESTLGNIHTKIKNLCIHPELIKNVFTLKNIIYDLNDDSCRLFELCYGLHRDYRLNRDLYGDNAGYIIDDSVRIFQYDISILRHDRLYDEKKRRLYSRIALFIIDNFDT